MPFTDLRNIVDINQNLHADICIIGAGAAGSVLALELAKTGKKIILAESGGEQADEVTQELYDLEFTGLPFRKNFVNRVREYGGSCNTWTGRSMQYTAHDFLKKNWVKHSGWPIDFSSLESYYLRAIPYLNLPSAYHFDLDYWYPGLSQQERGFFHNQNLAPTLSLWAKTPARFGIGSKHHRQIRGGKNIHLFLGANLTNLELKEGHQRVEKANFLALNGKALTVAAKHFILACGGLENARLLLLSNQQIPVGLGNQHDNVGRYFMDHPKFEGGIIKLNQPVRWNYFAGRPIWSGKVRIGLALSQEVQQKEALLNPYLTLTPTWSDSFTQNFPQKIMTEDLKGPFREKNHYHKLVRYYLRNTLRPPKVTKFKLSNYLEQAPNRESRVYLGDKKDSLGLNKLVLNWQIGSQEIQSIQRLHHYLAQHLKGNNIGDFVYPQDFFRTIPLSDASHHLGTTRMSETAKHGVVDKNCQVFDLPNLFIAGSSVFPTSGYANPTFTILALAIRLADFLKKLV